MRYKITIDYAQLCPKFNTTYLDRDNTDPKTVACMHAITNYFDILLSTLKERFGLQLYRMGHDQTLSNKELCTNRFLFYSLEKEITKQSFILSALFVPIHHTDAWQKIKDAPLLITNDAMGEAIYIYLDDNSKAGEWLLHELKNFDKEKLA